jgi:hypothetical protein
MTIGEALKAKLKRARIIAFGFWLAFAASIFMPATQYKAFALVPFAGFMASIVYTMFFIRCPKCDFKLGQVMSGLSTVNFCPGCGVDFKTRGQ